MADVKSLKQAVEALDPSELAEFRRWFAEFDAAAWGGQLEADAASGKLDALLAEAQNDQQKEPHRLLFETHTRIQPCSTSPRPNVSRPIGSPLL
jgi:hypothetical protein